MRWGILTDHLVQRDPFYPILDLASELLPQAPVYTLMYDPESVLGPIQSHNIYSSFLTGLRQKSKASPHVYSHLFGAATEQMLKKKWEVDALLVFSRGWVTTLASQLNLPQVFYAIDFPQEISPSLLKRLFYGPFIKSFLHQGKAISPNKLFLADLKLQEYFETPGELVLPPLKISDYPFFTKVDELKKDFYVCSFEGLDSQKIKELVEQFETHQTKLIFVGKSPMADDYFNNRPWVESWGERCAGDLSYLHSHARFSIDFSTHYFPSFGLNALLSGTPIVRRSLDNPFLNQTLGIEIEDLAKLNLRELDQSSKTFNRSSLRQHALGFNEMRFRQVLKRAMEGI